jgi:hypothetical protein
VIAKLRDLVTYRAGETERQGYVVGRCWPNGEPLVDIRDRETREVLVNRPASVIVALVERRAYGSKR